MLRRPLFSLAAGVAVVAVGTSNMLAQSRATRGAPLIGIKGAIVMATGAQPESIDLAVTEKIFTIKV